MANLVPGTRNCLELDAWHQILRPVAAERIWIAAFGPGLSVYGMDEGGKFEQAQVATTVAKYLDFDFSQQNVKVRPPLPILKK